jgi:uncharacterized protein YndB with AHSA1/START domain
VATEVDIDAPRAAVFGVLTEPSTYPDWLVGARRIRRIDGEWPQPGSSFHHSVGFGPLLIHDRTEVVGLERPSLLVLDARAGPLGRAGVRFRLLPTGTGTHLRMNEEPWSGPLRQAWRATGLPVVGPPLGALLRRVMWGRNALSLEHLRDLVEARVEAGPGPTVSERRAPRTRGGSR